MLRKSANPIIFLLPAACAAVAGCAQGGHFPSLLPRPIEKIDANGGANAAAPAPAVPQDPALAQQLTQLLAQARQGQQAFEKELGAAEAAVARAGSTGSDSWIAAQVAVTRLEGARADTTAALSDLDTLLLGRTREGNATNEADEAAASSTREQIQALADAQSERIAALSGRLSG